MKKIVKSAVIVLCLLGLASTVQAYGYSFDIISGGFLLDVNSDASMLSLATTQDILVGIDFDPPPTGSTVDYRLSTDLDVLLYGFLGYQVVMDDIGLGSFEALDPSAWFGDGTNPVTYAGSSAVNGQFSDYALADATLDYDVTLSPTGADRTYAIALDTFSLYGGNTQDLLTAVIDDLNQSPDVPITIMLPFSLPINLSGTVDVTASPVPVPAAFWLFGSGLLGLVTIRRKWKA